jgi:hypothetical protein
MLAAVRKGETMGDGERVTFRAAFAGGTRPSGRPGGRRRPAELVDALGGRKQVRVQGTLGGAPYAGSGMLVAGGGLRGGPAA